MRHLAGKKYAFLTRMYEDQNPIEGVELPDPEYILFEQVIDFESQKPIAVAPIISGGKTEDMKADGTVIFWEPDISWQLNESYEEVLLLFLHDFDPERVLESGHGLVQDRKLHHVIIKDHNGFV